MISIMLIALTVLVIIFAVVGGTIYTITRTTPTLSDRLELSDRELKKITAKAIKAGSKTLKGLRDLDRENKNA
ncbi:hypothetical protein [Providencia phage PSTCR5]|uniref:Uncharacterized protein n=1 Tax=Providencia phage PSTCR5 TaxID=2783547 RepID=A0A873WHQ7_9CAUD|nr:hypothetical protein KNV68_gp074 [Providencia phage PSTCR5]QPB12172.1 hypothetical protein [Providencia phage PSTCR5]